MRKQVMVKYELFELLCRFFLLEDYSVNTAIKKQLEEKLDALVNHDLYTTYKTSLSESEREEARIEYLNRKGVPEDFRR